MSKRRENLPADLTPLIDVVFLLLIFFLVTSVFKKEESAINLNLPKTKTYSKQAKSKNILIEISKNEIAVDGNIKLLEEIDEVFSQITNKEISVKIRIDEEVTYKKIMTIFDLLQAYELTNILLITEKI